jgi:hypothetical protein
MVQAVIIINLWIECQLGCEGERGRRGDGEWWSDGVLSIMSMLSKVTMLTVLTVLTMLTYCQRFENENDYFTWVRGFTVDIILTFG